MFNGEEDDNFIKMDDLYHDDIEYMGGGPVEDKEYGCFNSVFIVRWFLTILFALFPKKKVISYTAEGEDMRDFVILAMFAHMCFFMFCFSYIGFMASAVNMGFTIWCYSLYLTLSTWKIYLYILAMCGYIGWTFVYQFIDFGWNMRFVGRLLNLALYVGIIFGIYKKYVPLKKVGGIYGTTGKEGKNSMDSSAAKLFDKACKGLEKG